MKICYKVNKHNAILIEVQYTFVQDIAEFGGTYLTQKRARGESSFISPIYIIVYIIYFRGSQPIIQSHL